MRICWAEKGDIKTLTDFWYVMTCEMEEKDGIPRPSMGRVHEVKDIVHSLREGQTRKEKQLS